VSATCCLPLVQGFYGQPFEIVGRPPANAEDTPAAGWSVVSPDFFEVFRIPIKRGRALTATDNARAPRVVVINESMAREEWKDRDPLLDRIAIGGSMMKEFQDEPPRQIVGIVGDIRSERLNADPLPMMYVPQEQISDAQNAWLVRNGMAAWVIRTQVKPYGLAQTIREQLQHATGVSVSDVLSMDEVVSISTSRQRFNVLLMTVFACSALLLAAVGVYGLIAYSVEQRTQEIGIRLALGADPKQIRNMVVRQGMSLALVGAGIGIGAAWTLSHLLESLLFGVQARDPMVFLVIPVVLGAVALLAVWLPANHASQVNPIDTLRYG
jgi:putative ABC transport system permease protein